MKRFYRIFEVDYGMTPITSTTTHLRRAAINDKTNWFDSEQEAEAYLLINLATEVDQGKDFTILPVWSAIPD